MSSTIAHFAPKPAKKLLAFLISEAARSPFSWGMAKSSTNQMRNRSSPEPTNVRFRTVCTRLTATPKYVVWR